MQDEFPELNYKNYQDEFLSDWWTRKKLFKGLRSSGKTTLIVSELRRFLNRGMDCLVLAPTQDMTSSIIDRYRDRFRELPHCDFKSYFDVREHRVRGNRYDVVLMDEMQELDFEHYVQEIQPMNSMFVRACACQSSLSNIHYLVDEDGESGYFDSVYTSF